MENRCFSCTPRISTAPSSNSNRPEDKLLINLVKTLSRSFWSTLAVVAVVSAGAVAVVVNGFDLRISGGLALYFVIWWILLFAVLPFGVRSQVEAGEVVRGSEPGAPALPALREKAIWTTLVASIVLVVVAAVFPLAGL
jgi:predicted secreted protein